MSARAAARLEIFGFDQVYRYTPGKDHWLANGWPIEGTLADAPNVGSYARRDVPTCLATESIGDVQPRTQGWNICVVITRERIVIGLLRQQALQGETHLLAEAVMETAPRTYRMNAMPDKVASYMRKHNVDSVLVTTSDGKLIGALKLEDLDTI